MSSQWRRQRLADAVEDCVRAAAALEINDLQELHLREDHMVRQAFDEPLV